MIKRGGATNGSGTQQKNDMSKHVVFLLVRVVGLKPTSLAVPNRAFYQLNYTRIFDFQGFQRLLV